MRKSLLAAVSAASLFAAGAISPVIAQSNTDDTMQSQTESGASSTTAPDASEMDANTPTETESSDSAQKSDQMADPTTAEDSTGSSMSTTADTGGNGTGEMTAQQPADTHLASDLTGQPVQNSEGDDLADIDDFVIGPDGKISHVIVSFGGFLGLGDKEVMLPWEQMDISMDEDGDEVVTLAMTQEQIESLPQFVSQEEANEATEADAKPADGGSTGMGTGTGTGMTGSGSGSGTSMGQ
ncbi:PRC-barrel domain-containing protein [Amorphus sp. 3PC139-8]|uniref:PRC-barrel domain-containing protein n=1 Tax=Amorphus sp. 3PC139-8 TaxID=2735676 RepID=UPI00345D6526